MKILVTGAGGYVGRHIVSKLLDMGHEVIASSFYYDGIDTRAIRIGIPIFSGDANIYEQLGKPDVCIHLAWRDGFKHNSDFHTDDFSSHIVFLKNMIRGGLKKLSVMGTMHEVGYWEGAIDENTPCNPLSQYGIAKNALRQSLLLFAKNTECSVRWLRAYYITGNDAHGSSIFSKITQAVAEGKQEFPFTTGKNQYDFIDIDLLAEMICIASIQDDEDGIINVCTGTPKSLAERVEEYIKEHNFNIKLNYGAFPDRPYDSPGVWGDATKIKAIMSKFYQQN